MTETDTTKIAAIDDKEAQQYGELAVEKGKKKEFIESYRYQTKTTSSGGLSGRSKDERKEF